MFAHLAGWIERRIDRFRCPVLPASDPILVRLGDGIVLDIGVPYRWRYGREIRLSLHDAELLAEMLPETIAEAKEWREHVASPSAPQCPGGGS